MSLTHTSAPTRERVTVGPIQVADQAVLAEYSPAERWNGFLCPRLDALAAVTVLSELTALQPTSTAWTFGVDGSLIVINLDYVASGDNVDNCTDTYAPDRDGLYALGAWSWTWQEADSEALAPGTAASRMLARYGAWSARREALPVVEDDPGASVSATDRQASDDEAAELAHGLARLLSDTLERRC